MALSKKLLILIILISIIGGFLLSEIYSIYNNGGLFLGIVTGLPITLYLKCPKCGARNLVSSRIFEEAMERYIAKNKSKIIKEFFGENGGPSEFDVK